MKHYVTDTMGLIRHLAKSEQLGKNASKLFEEADTGNCVVFIPAHFDGKQIQLDEPNDERAEWLNLSIQGLKDGYGEDETEYPTDLIKKVNPHYAGK